MRWLTANATRIRLLFLLPFLALVPLFSAWAADSTYFYRLDMLGLELRARADLRVNAKRYLLGFGLESEQSQALLMMRQWLGKLAPNTEFLFASEGVRRAARLSPGRFCQYTRFGGLNRTNVLVARPGDRRLVDGSAGKKKVGRAGALDPLSAVVAIASVMRPRRFCEKRSWEVFDGRAHGLVEVLGRARASIPDRPGLDKRMRGARGRVCEIIVRNIRLPKGQDQLAMRLWSAPNRRGAPKLPVLAETMEDPPLVRLVLRDWHTGGENVGSVMKNCLALVKKTPPP